MRVPQEEEYMDIVICGIHNHDLCHKLSGHPIVCCLNSKEKKLIYHMTFNTIQPKNILSTLKRKRPENVSNIKQVHNIHTRNNKAIRCLRFEMQHLLKLLGDDNYFVHNRVNPKIEIWTNS